MLNLTLDSKMGYNTSVVVINNALDQIANDQNFGKNLAEAVRSLSGRAPGTRIDVAAGNHCNAAHVVETHHADQTTIITVGGNLGLLRASAYGWTDTPETQKALLAAWAEKLGYHLVKNKDCGQ